MERSLSQSLRHAVYGVVIAWRRERNIRVHMGAAIAVVVLATILKVSRGELLILLVMIALVLLAEGMNTALEMLSDIQNPRLSSHIGQLKDVSAGVVLVTSVIAAMVGLIVFLPHLLSS